ncbi:hypothetical protein [Enterobacter hormaechei]|uniref:hypothetical protein n=1 Tax=Enterobacter hormaechei TaxID=158836 RepID=UPI001EFC2E64|nr:hypothetical protein [Enterobacter hormaechei]
MTFTKERLTELSRRENVGAILGEEIAELARIALASLEAEPVCVIDQSNLDYLKSGSDADVWPASRTEMGDVLLYRAAPPAPVSVPAAMEMDDDFDSAFEHGKAVGWNAYRAAMLQGADRPQNEPQNIPENIPATQFKPVADLYGLTSPTGGETSFTFDAVEARDFIDGGWSCQEYVTLERYQETLFQGAEPVSLRDGIAAIRNLGPIDAEKIQAERDALNSPVIPDGWALVPIDPTEDMIVNGFESEPDESFSDEKEWEAYDAMSGCQQAAHRAKLCWAAMISAAPKPDVR